MAYKEDDIAKEKHLSFYKIILQSRINCGLDMTRLLITISVSLVALIPQFYKDIHSELLYSSLIGFGIVVICGLLMNRLDYRQLESLHNQNEGKESFDYSKITYTLLIIMICTFICSLAQLIYIACNYQNYKKELCMEEKIIRIELKNPESKPTFDDLSGIVSPNKEQPTIKKKK